MTATPVPAPAEPALAEIARDALLHYLDRGQTRQALHLALMALSHHQGGPCGLQALDAEGSTRWHEGVHSAHVLAVAELGREHGRLFLPAPVPAAELAPLLPTLASLLHHDAQTVASSDLPTDLPSDLPYASLVDTPAALLRAALAGTDTFAWEWNLDNDWLGDIDEGLRLLGYERSEVGHTQEDWNRLIHPDDLAANDLAYQRHACGETEIYEHCYRARHKNGQWRWMQERGRVVERHPDGRPRRVVGTQVDITERLASERQATDAVQRLEQIARQVPGMLYMVELQRGQREQLRYATDRSVALFGLSLADALQDMAVFWALVPEDDGERMRQAFRLSARTLCDWRCEFRVRSPDGGWRHMSGSATPQRLSDELTRWYGYIEDVTERVQLDQARRDAALASAANRAKTEFLSRMSHELRTPLNAVLGFTQLIEIDPVDRPTPGQSRRLALVRAAGEHLLRMISDLLDLTRIETGGLALQFEAVAAHTLAAQTLEMMRSAADAAQVRLQLEDGGQSLCVRADRTRLRQVLLNLLSNAIKYNHPGGVVSLRVELAAMEGGSAGSHSGAQGLAAGDIGQDAADHTADHTTSHATRHTTSDTTGLGPRLGPRLGQTHTAEHAGYAETVDESEAENAPYHGGQGMCLISVADTGQGIAPADLPHVFEPFQRGQQAHSTVEGTGIGLSVTQALVAMMGGRVLAESQPGQGSRFCVELPLAVQTAAPAAAAGRSEASAT